MTMAVCFNCGTIKFGAFAPCPGCKTEPKSDDDLVLSLAMTDHYHDAGELHEMARKIKQGLRPELPDNTRQEMLDTLRQLRATDNVFAKMMKAKRKPDRLID